MTTEPQRTEPTEPTGPSGQTDQNQPTALRTHLCGVLAPGRRRPDRDRSAAGWPAGASTASTWPSWTCGTTRASFSASSTTPPTCAASGSSPSPAPCACDPRAPSTPASGRARSRSGTAPSRCSTRPSRRRSRSTTAPSPTSRSGSSYRYVDLRRPRMQRNLRLRARVNAALRRAMDRQGFVEIETPLLWAPTPEGSREFSVPCPTAPRLLLRAAPEPAAGQAAAHGRRLRPLLPDRPLPPGRGPPGRPPVRVHAARYGVFLRLPGRRHGLRLRGRPRRRRGGHGGAAATDCAHDVGRRAGPLRHRQARPALRHGAGRPHRRLRRHRGQGLLLADRQGDRGPRWRRLPAQTARRPHRAGQEGRRRRAGLVPCRTDGPALDGPLARHLSEQEVGARPGTDGGGTGDLILAVSDEYARPARCWARCAWRSGRPP